METCRSSEQAATTFVVGSGLIPQEGGGVFQKEPRSSEDLQSAPCQPGRTRSSRPAALPGNWGRKKALPQRPLEARLMPGLSFSSHRAAPSSDSQGCLHGPPGPPDNP